MKNTRFISKIMSYHLQSSSDIYRVRMKIILVIGALFLLTCKNVDAQSGVQVYFFGKIISDHQILTVASIKNLSKSLSKHFDSKLRTFVYIPGLAKPFNDEEPQTVIKSLIQLWSNSNIVLIDWSASPTDSVGATLMFKEADIILSNIIGAGLKAESTHVIGFGLGTFIAGYVAQYFNNASLPLARVTGLNPHNLVNSPFMAPYELKRSDATFVDIIHTDEVFGSPTTNGHADFWPNQGKDQAGCFGDGELKKSKLDGNFNAFFSSMRPFSRLEVFC